MGGYGSGRRPKKDMVEQYINLDISGLKRTIIANRAGPAVGGTLKWSGGSSMGFELHWLDGRPELLLSYSYTPYTGEAQNRTQRIPIATTACPYGGVRYWLRCFACSRRMKKLYFKSGVFACRHCHQLVYRSAQAAHSDDKLGRSMGVRMRALDWVYKVDDLMQRWYNKNHLTHGERCKLAAALGVPVGKVRNKWYQPATRLKMVAANAKAAFI